jgi:hypothetical protein
MGARGAAYSREQGRLTARNLADVGVNVDLAPVLDVARPGGVIADTDRAFGSTADRVAATAVPFATALQDGGVARDTIGRIAQAGANVFVAGSAVYGAPDIGAEITALRELADAAAA